MAPSDLRDLGPNLTQRFGPADDLLEHRGAHDLLAQGEIFAAHPVLVPFSLVDVGPRRIPADDSSVGIEQRAVVDQIPAILAVPPESPLLVAEGTGRESTSCRSSRNLSTSSGWKTRA